MEVSTLGGSCVCLYGGDNYERKVSCWFRGSVRDEECVAEAGG